MFESANHTGLWRGSAASLLTLFMLLFAPLLAQAEEASVAVEVDSIAEGRPFWIAIQLKPDPDTMVTWIDSETGGRGITFVLDLPEGFEKGEALLPAPNAIGFEDHRAFLQPVWVLQEILVARNLPFQKNYTFQGRLIQHQYYYKEEEFADKETGFSFVLPFGLGEANQAVAETFSEARAKIPQPFPWPVIYLGDDDSIELTLYMTSGETDSITNVFLAPLSGTNSNEISYTLEFEKNEEGIFVTAQLPEGVLARKKLSTLISFWRDSEQQLENYYLEAKNSFEKDASISLSDPDLAGYTIWLALGLAFLGGILLNLMPCVFPVLTLKVFTLVKSGTMSRRQMRLDGLAYTVGILFSFLIVALLLLTFRSMGQQVGWGFQLQSPYFVVAMAIILLLVALVFLGVINIRLPFAIEGKSEAEGTLGSFYTGMLATVVATPCTAPFMAPALGFALTLKTMEAVAVFMGLGLGLAAPYLLVSVIPKVQSIFPKPGPWMETFKKILAIPLLLTVGWLGWVLYTQTSDERQAVSEYAVEWSPEAVWNLRLQGKGVFVNYTATWCLTCIVNERLVFKNDKFQRFLVDNNIVYMEADWTRPNPEIAASLESLGRSGLPVYAFYPPGGPTRDVILLPEILTLESALERISAELE